MKEHTYFKNYLISDKGHVVNKATNKKIAQSKNEFGYLTVKLLDPIDGKWKTRRVHRLVAEVYIENPENKPEVNHIDGVKFNNEVTNLEWVTSKENKDHGWATGLYTKKGDKHPDAILDEETVHEICRLMEEGARNIDISKAFNIDKDWVSHIRCGDIWQHISNNYSIQIKRVERKSPEIVIKIAELLELGWKDKRISEYLKVSSREVNRIRNRQTHSSLTKDYDF